MLLSLFLTIYVTLAVIHSGAPAYGPLDQNMQQLAFADEEEYQWAIWGDLASFAWPDDEEAQAGLRRGLYVGECIIIVVCLLLCASGLMTAVCIYSFVGAGLPDALSKTEYGTAKVSNFLSSSPLTSSHITSSPLLRYLLDALAYFFFMWPCFDLVVIFLASATWQCHGVPTRAYAEVIDHCTAVITALPPSLLCSLLRVAQSNPVPLAAPHSRVCYSTLVSHHEHRMLRRRRRGSAARHVLHRRLRAGRHRPLAAVAHCEADHQRSVYM